MNEKLDAMLNKLAKWRTVFAGWQLGTRADTDPECQAVRDHISTTMMLRAENSALVALLMKKGVFTKEEWEEMLYLTAEDLDKLYEKRFPGITTTSYGLKFDTKIAAETMKYWRK